MTKTRSQAVKDWRTNTKKRIVSAMGGCCQICGYNRCLNALELHHIDPSQKEISFSRIRANPKNWLSIVDELRKCILLCSICHKEVHAEIVNLPEVYTKFDESYVDYKSAISTNKKCASSKCNNNLTIGQDKYCSTKCTLHR